MRKRERRGPGSAERSSELSARNDAKPGDALCLFVTRDGAIGTPRKYASGETDRNGGISRCGDRMVRALLCEAANVLLTRVQRWSWLKHWGVDIARRRGKVRAQVAVARRLAVIMHRMWIDRTPVPVEQGCRRRGSTSVGKRSNREREITESASADASGRT